MATIGGNVAHALPAGDGTIALLALGAEVEIASPHDRRWQKAEDLFLSPGEVVFDRAKEILIQFRIPFLREGEKTIFHRIMRPQGLAIAILNMAMWARIEGEGIIKDIRLALGPAGPKPLRARKTEDVLRGHFLNEDKFSLAIEALQKEAKVRTSPHRATKEYREHLLGLLLRNLFGSINIFL